MTLQDDRELRGAVLRTAIYVALALAVLSIRHDLLITRWLFLRQDALASVAVVGTALAALWLRPCWSALPRLPTLGLVVAAAISYAMLLWAGTHAVMLDYALTRDELMVEFDQANFAVGRLSAHLPSAWTGFGPALVPDFALGVPGQALLASAYGPVNAALRAGFGLVADPTLLNPLLAAAGLLSLHRIARRLLWDSPGAQWLVLIGYVISAQIALNAMTSYAMTAHLALNLIWLALYLKNKWWSHALAMLVGVLAIGLHQVVFHPLFAGPIILSLLVARRRRLFAAYAAVYLSATVLWISWPQIVMAAGGLSTQPAYDAGSRGFVASRVLPVLMRDHGGDVPLMLYNFMRTVAWNPAFMLPFAMLAIPAVRRRDPMALPLAAGLLLTIVAVTVLLAYQGHGWGYRYVHGVLGNCLLLAGYGYREVARRGREPAAAGVAAGLAATTALIVPWLVATTHSFIAPYARLSTLISHQDADFVIIDSNGPGFAVDQVRNRPDLSNRPLIFSSADLTRTQVGQLCDRGSVMLFGRELLASGEPFLRNLPTSNPAFERQIASLRGRSCVRRVAADAGDVPPAERAVTPY